MLAVGWLLLPILFIFATVASIAVLHQNLARFAPPALWATHRPLDFH